MPTHFAGITATTTDAELEKPVLMARAAIVGEAEGPRGAAEILLAVHRLAEAESIAQVASTVRNIRRLAEGEEAVGKIRDFLVRRLCASPDDTWSGRKNDLARVRADAVRDAISNTLELL